MSKRIVIIPNFGESHLIKCQIPNLVDTLRPDVVIYNESLFPKGPESKTNINEEFRKKYCYQDTNLAWDTLETQQLINQAQIDYPNVKWIHNEMKFPKDTSASEAYTMAVSNFKDLGIEVEEGDFIFPYEPDIFHHESISESLTNLLEQLNPNQGFTSVWLDFVGTQNYIEKNNNPFIGNVRGRKLCIRFGTMDFYQKITREFESQSYRDLFKSNLLTFHYNWFRFEKNKQLRFDQIVRRPEYWNMFNEGLEEIYSNTVNKIEQDVVLRPERFDHMRWASYINIEHPNAIKTHPNYIQ